MGLHIVHKDQVSGNNIAYQNKTVIQFLWPARNYIKLKPAKDVN